MSMKTLSIYLLIIIVLLGFGCQKDIETEENISKEKNCCRVIYLPVRIDHINDNTFDTSHVYYEYLNDKGDLKKINGSLGYELNYTYSNGQLKKAQLKWEPRQNQLVGETFWTYHYNNNICTGYDIIQWVGTPDPNSEPDENGQYPESSITWKEVVVNRYAFEWDNNRITSVTDTEGVYRYTYDEYNLKAAKETENTIPTYYSNFYYTHNDKNYFAKDVRNKELSMPVGFSPFGIAHSYKNDIIRIDWARGHISDPPFNNEYYVFKNKYNAAGYPIEIDQTYHGISDNGPYQRHSKSFITYKKITIHN